MVPQTLGTTLEPSLGWHFGNFTGLVNERIDTRIFQYLHFWNFTGLANERIDTRILQYLHFWNFTDFGNFTGPPHPGRRLRRLYGLWFPEGCFFFVWVSSESGSGVARWKSNNFVVDFRSQVNIYQISRVWLVSRVPNTRFQDFTGLVSFTGSKPVCRYLARALK